MPNEPIQEYGVIGNMRTVALISTAGSVDWFCFPNFDSPSVFGALLDSDQGGSFRIAPTEPALPTKQFYVPDTNVLVTRFMLADGVAELEDFMPAGVAQDSAWHEQLVRRLRVVRGKVRFRLDCRPAFDYARSAHQTTLSDAGATFEAVGHCAAEQAKEQHGRPAAHPKKADVEHLVIGVVVFDPEDLGEELDRHDEADDAGAEEEQAEVAMSESDHRPVAPEAGIERHALECTRRSREAA